GIGPWSNPTIDNLLIPWFATVTRQHIVMLLWLPFSCVERLIANLQSVVGLDWLAIESVGRDSLNFTAATTRPTTSPATKVNVATTVVAAIFCIKLMGLVSLSQKHHLSKSARQAHRRALGTGFRSPVKRPAETA